MPLTSLGLPRKSSTSLGCVLSFLVHFIFIASSRAQLAFPDLYSDPYTYNARSFNFTLSNFRAPFGGPSAFAESILECQYNFFQTLQQFPNTKASDQISGGGYVCPKTDVIINATNAATLFQGAPSSIAQTLGRRGLTLNSTGTVSKQQGIEFNFSYVQVVNLMAGLYLGALSFGDSDLPAFDWQAFDLVQGNGGVQAVPVARGSWA